jgi:hypothetical protein
MSLPMPPSISQGEIALDPVNGIVWYLNDAGTPVATTWSWLRKDLSVIETDDKVEITGDVDIAGNLYVEGSTITVDAESVVIKDNFIVVNSTDGAATSSTAGLEVERGTSTNVQIRWNESINKWQFTNDGINYSNIISTLDNGTITSEMIVDNTIVNADINTSAAIAHSKLANATAGQILLGTTTTGVITATTVSGDITINGAGLTAISSAVIVDADINASAAIAISKLASGTSGQIIIANASGVPTYTTISGDITISNTGVATIVANSVALGTDTTGNYVASLVAGTGVSLLNNTGEGSTPTISIGQSVGTTDTVTFNTVNASLVGNVTGTVSDISNHEISDLSDVVITDAANGDFLRYNGSNWINDPVNLTTDTVGDYVKNLVAGNGITITNNSGEGATPNISFSGSINDLSDLTITSAQNGQILEYDGTAWVNTVRPSSEPIGHENKADSVISFDEGSRQFSIAPVSTSYTVWCTGKRYVKTTTESVTIPDTSGLYYIYFNSSGSLAYKTTFFTWDQDTPTAYIYWNENDNKAYFFADERHGVTLDWATHEYLHRTRGAAIANGFGASWYSSIIGGPPNGDGSEDSHAQIDIANGTFFDEDLQVDIEHASSPTANTWQQRLQSGAYIPVFYRLNNHWTKDVATQFPVKNGGTRAQFNLNTAGTWSSTAIDNSKFGVMFVVATNNLNEPIISIMGQAQYTDQGSAEASIWDELDLAGFPVVEFRPLYKIVFQTATSYENSPKTKFVNLLDLRQIISAGIGGAATAVSDHGLMTGLSDDDHTQYFNVSRHDAHDHSAALSSASINDLNDVNVSTVNAGEGLIWNGSQWANAAIPLSLDGLSDVVITAATPNQVIKYDGTQWVNSVSPSSVEGTTHFATIGNSTDITFVINHNLSTRDVVVNFTETTSPYSNFNTLWEATTLNSITIYFETPPSSNSVRVSIYAALSGAALTSSLDELSDVAISSVSSGEFLKYDGSNWVNSQIPPISSIDDIQNVSAATPSSDQVLAWDSVTSQWIAKTFTATVSQLDAIGDVTVPSPSSGEYLKWNGSQWVNSNINLSSDTNGNYVQNLVAGSGISISNNSGEAATPTISVNSTISRSEVNVQTGTNYNLILSDLGKLITMDNSSPMTVTVPLDSSQAFTIGDKIDILRKGSGSLTITQEAGVTVNATPGKMLRSQWSSATLIKLDTNMWVAIGDLQA